VTIPGRGGHPSPEELDLLLEDGPESAGVGGAPQRDTTAAHVAGCARCAATVEEMAWVRELLRAEARRVPPPPLDLAARLTAALDAERRAPRGPHRPEADVVPLSRRRAGVPRWLAAAAGLVVLGGVATAATQLLGGDADVTSAGAARDTEHAAAGGAEVATSQPEAGTGVAAAALAPVVRTGQDYTAEGLDEQVRDLLVAAAAVAPAPRDGALPPALAAPQSRAEPGTGPSSGPARLAAPDALAGCLAAIGAADSVPQAVDLATYEGRPVAVIVLPADRGRSRVWVVDAACGPGDDGLVTYRVVAP
jgi:hypothetical protein